MEFIDLKAQYRALKPEIDANIQAVLDAGQFIGGPYVKELERQLAEYVGRKHCISCGNGTDALQAAYMALGVGEGDAVFCPDCTFIASVEPANMLGATPVFCDVSMDSYNLAPESLERQIQAVLSEGKLKPRVVVAVDFLGNPCDYDAIAAICDKYGLTLLEDAAQSMGASYKGKMCCSFGTISTTSFFPAKTLGCYGDGGAIFTDDDALADLSASSARAPSARTTTSGRALTPDWITSRPPSSCPSWKPWRSTRFGIGKLPQAATAPPSRGSSCFLRWNRIASTVGISTPFWRQIPPSGRG